MVLFMVSGGLLNDNQEIIICRELFETLSIEMHTFKQNMLHVLHL